MLVFAITGITLNHAADIPSTPKIVTIEDTLPAEQLSALANVEDNSLAPLPATLRHYFASSHQVHITKRRVGEVDDGEYYLALAGPGKDAWLAIDIESGEFTYESTDQGWVAYFNDLHKGRDTGFAWRVFIDVFSIACIVFCATGFWLLLRQTKTRASTWPWVSLGVLIPTVLLLLFTHS